MKILVACDKFKGSLTALEAGEAIASGLRAGLAAEAPWEIRLLPIADGGDGIAATLLAARGGEWIESEVLDPLSEPRRAGYALLASDGGPKTAVIEMAQASGLALLDGRDKDPRRATTYGTGQLIEHARRQGVSHLILGIGGSATNDGGSGMAEALGYRFEDASGHPLRGLPMGLEEVARILPPAAQAWPRVTVACDVDNPLLGPQGCTRVYGPQKGIACEDFPYHEARLEHLVSLLGESGRGAAATAGSGAAGGLGFGARVFLKAELVPGFDLVADQLGLHEAIDWADLVLTGEGRLDSQSLQGKGPHGVVRLARERGKPTAAFCGQVENRSLETHFGPIVEIRDPESTLEENLARAGGRLREAARKAAPSLSRLLPRPL